MINICMAGIDFNKARIDIRERFALTTLAQAEMLCEISRINGVSGCVIINTCNRMELWVSFEGAPEKKPFDILCDMFRIGTREYERFFTQRDGMEAVRHLFELACGLKSLIFGEEQILTQVKEAIAFSRDSGTADPMLEAVFQRAVTAAKKAKTKVQLTAVDRSAAKTVVEILKEKYGDLKGLPCLVIGSGEMGRLAAKGLLAEGCDVHITLRHYRSGEAVIPNGCCVVDYDERFGMLKNSKIIISATRSPHYTLSYNQVKELLGSDEKLLFDLAIPRDIDPEIARLSNIKLYDIDQLGGSLADSNENQSLAEVRAIIEDEIKELERWNCVRELMPKINEIGAAASSDVEERIQSSLKHIPLDENCLELVHEAAGKAVSKVVENFLLSVQKNADAEVLSSFLSSLSEASTEDARAEQNAEFPPRFPLFVDLSGKDIAVIGAGKIALRRIKTLLSYPCNVAVTAPEAVEEIERMNNDKRITLKKKEYEASDIKGAFLVVAATDDRELNRRISLDAGKNGQYCSIADCKEECTFYFPATVHYNGGVIGICGTGENHSMTKEIAFDIREYIKVREKL